MQCPKCGYMLAATDKTCPRCEADAPTQFLGDESPTQPSVPAFDMPTQPGAPQSPSPNYIPPTNPYPPAQPYPPANSYTPPPGYGSGYGAPPPGSYGAPMGSYVPTPASPPTSRNSSGAWLAIVLGILGLVFLLFIGLVAFVVVTVNKTSSSENAGSPSYSSPTATQHQDEPSSASTPSSGSAPSSAGETPTSSASGTGSAESGGKTTASEDEPLTTEGLKLVDDESVQRDGVYYVVGHVRNTTDHAIKNVSINFALTDDKDKNVGYASDDTPEIAPGETWNFKARIEPANAESYQLDSLVGE